MYSNVNPHNITEHVLYYAFLRCFRTENTSQIALGTLKT